MRYRVPRGTQDILPDQLPRWRYVEETFRRVCALYGYGELRTPVFEQTDLFVRSVGEHTDIVSKEMYSVVPSGARGDTGTQAGHLPEAEGGGGEPLTLRPEGTAPALRAYVQHNLGVQQPLTKLFYLCPIFRHERPQKGRLRQHHQAGVEALGSPDPALDAEVIALALAYLHALEISSEETVVNSVGCPRCRPGYRETLRAALQERIGTMCGDCQRRYDVNPLRILDCKKEDWAAIGDVPDILDSLCEECAAHFGGLTRALDALGIRYRRDARLVRGFDYYTKTAFEITHPDLGAQSALVGGGRYDGLVEELGGPPTPGIGFGSGIERVLIAAEELGVIGRWPVEKLRPVFVVTLGEAARLPGLRLLADLRAAGVAAETDYQGRSMKAQMREANRLNARGALILGEDELAAGEVAWRDFDAGEQVRLPLAGVVEQVRC